MLKKIMATIGAGWRPAESAIGATNADPSCVPIPKPRDSGRTRDDNEERLFSALLGVALFWAVVVWVEGGLSVAHFQLFDRAPPAHAFLGR